MRRSITQFYCPINKSSFTINEECAYTICWKYFGTIRINSSSVSNRCVYSKGSFRARKEKINNFKQINGSYHEKELENEAKEQKGGFVDMFIGIGVVLLGNMLACKWVIRAGKEVVKNGECKNF